MQNYLKNETSPYLLQHADNPVNWYPWCEEAFAAAKKEEKPVFLSIGYSTCHWCHVMAHESFEDEEIARILNQNFISIKVDKEERPDIDSIYMTVCQAFTGSGGWPTTVFLTPEQKPFFAGTYFPKTARYGQVGFRELLLTISEEWKSNRFALLDSAEKVIETLAGKRDTENSGKTDMDFRLVEHAVKYYKRTFDEVYGGFGEAPKFPTPHNLLFLMRHYEKSGEVEALEMVEKTLIQMYRGGLFDHIGGGFSRYSTDRYFLAPHFEKMLYDNALLIMAYSKACQLTGKTVYRMVAEKTADYILREMTSKEGGFFSAQDADSEGVEGKYYLFEPSEVKKVLKEEAGEVFKRQFDITEKGNFEGKNIPNLLQSELSSGQFEECLQKLYEYRKNRCTLHLDDKILTSWNGLMIAAFCHLYRVTGTKRYLETAEQAGKFVEDRLCKESTLYVSFRDGKHSGKGFLDDYANMIFAWLALYEATLEQSYLEKAEKFCEKAITDFYDREQGGFFLYGAENEQLIMRPKETYDGAMPSGNSMMAYNLVQFYLLKGKDAWKELAEQQLKVMSSAARQYPAGYAMFLMALSDYQDIPNQITIVQKDGEECGELALKIPLHTTIRILKNPTKEYPLKNKKMTFYVCTGRSCLPPVNDLAEVLRKNRE